MAGADPPADKLLAAAEESATFCNTWIRTLNDLNDRSASGHDLG
ncbi:MAG: hypothetical protein NT069_07755 [Planctomycetota bacterium]|nr:hypothetical protein [Planctomycetota bacterium]